MTNCTFMPEEILAITTGRLAILQQDFGVDYEFIKIFVEKLNCEIANIRNSGVFNINLKLLNDQYLDWSKTYFYDEERKRFFTKSDMLFRVLEHFEFAENKVIKAIYTRQKLRKKKDSYDIQKSVKDMLYKVLQETIQETTKEYKFKL